MDIRPVVSPAAAPSGPTTQPTRSPGQTDARATAANAVQPEPPATKEAKAPERVEGPRVAKVRTELLFDDSIKRVVGRMFDRETGETVRELPPEEIRQLYARTREQLASIFDETA